MTKEKTEQDLDDEITSEDLLNQLLDYADDNECNVKINYHGIYKNFKIQFFPERRKRFGNEKKENFKLEVFNANFKDALEDILKQVTEKLHPQLQQ